MTLVMTNPWKDLDKGKVIAVKDLYNHNIYWGKDGNSRFALLFRLKDKVKDEVKIILKGIDFIYKEENKQMALILKSNEDWEIFKILCEDLITIAKAEDDESKMIKNVIDRLHTWKNLLDRNDKKGLSREEQMGILTELHTLLNFVIPVVGTKQGVTSWTGPDRDAQDFLLENSVVEVKSCISSKGKIATISNSNQLVSTKEHLYLVHYTLTPFNTGEHINEYIEKILLTLKEEDEKNLFYKKLAECGALNQETNELLRFKIDEISYYIVTEEFPKLEVKDMDKRIINLKYSIDLKLCEEFKIDKLEV